MKLSARRTGSGDSTGSGSSGDLASATASGCRVLFFAGELGWSYGGFAAMQIEARNLPFVIVWVGSFPREYNDAAFAAGFDLTLFCELTTRAPLASSSPSRHAACLHAGII